MLFPTFVSLISSLFKRSENEDEAAEVALGLQFTGLGLCEASGPNSCLGGIGTYYPERYATSMLYCYK